MNELQFLTWVRGPALDWALAIFILGVVWRLVEVLSLGRRKDLAAARSNAAASGLQTVFRRFLPPREMGLVKASPVTYVGGYVFHIGLAVIVLLFAPHIKLIGSLIGVTWPALPSQIVDLVTVVTLAALVAVLVDRLKRPAKRYLSTFGDYFTWAVTFLPILTGWLTVQHLLLPYTTMLALHILSAEILLVVLPFTKLFHAFTVFPSRWFNGRANAQKGVPV